MSHYEVTPEAGTYTLADLETKLKLVNWEWSREEEGTDAFDAGQEKMNDALKVYSSLRFDVLGPAPEPGKVDRTALDRINNVWDKYATTQYKVPKPNDL